MTHNAAEEKKTVQTRLYKSIDDSIGEASYRYEKFIKVRVWFCTCRCVKLIRVEGPICPKHQFDSWANFYWYHQLGSTVQCPGTHS